MKTYIDYSKLHGLFEKALQEDRSFLYEFEVYEFIKLIGGETPPKCHFHSKDTRLNMAAVEEIPGDKIVIKVVSPYILHKSDVTGVRICEKTDRDILSTLRRMSHEIPDTFAQLALTSPELAPPRYTEISEKNPQQKIADDITGYMFCQYMAPDSEEFGNELLVSLRNSREFGTILTAGLGGRDTELYAARFRKGQAIVSAPVEMISGKSFFELFTTTISYKKLAGLTRGQQRIVTDNQLLECFEAFVQIGRHFSIADTSSPVTIEELEVNPFAFSNYLMMPLDGLCLFSRNKKDIIPKNIGNVDQLLHPKSIAVAGVSATKSNIGRIILGNIITNDFPKKQITLIHPRVNKIDTIPAVESIDDLKEKIDLLILAVDGSLLPEMINQILIKENVASVILISAGLGEKEDQQQLVWELQEQLQLLRNQGVHTPVFLGGNSLGVLSHPGYFDAMFIPDSKLPKTRGNHKRGVALISQSGAYMITRMSKLAFLDPAYAISIGNQLDLTAGDFLHYFKDDEDLHTLAFYMEGFADLDGLNFATAITETVTADKDVIFYKAGRTPEGKDALSGHTASIAGDYMVCESCVSLAGAMVAETFNIFEGLLKLSSTLYNKKVTGNRLAAVSNAGYEAVGIADNILGEDYHLELAQLEQATFEGLKQILNSSNLDSLTTVHNPLDITPMASEETYIRVITCLLEDKTVDVIVIAIVPLTPMLHTLPEELIPGDQCEQTDSIISKIDLLNKKYDKPLVIVVDSGKLYDPMAEGFEHAGLPVFRSADLCVSALGKYIDNKLSRT